MKIYIVIPAHNEANFIGKTLQSLADQSLKPDKLIVVDDSSTDDTASIVEKFAVEHSFIKLIRNNSSTEHAPGSKVINAFYKGFYELDDSFDVICKFDADLIFPENYLEKIVQHFENDSLAGMAGGFCSVQRKDKWIPENLTGKDHIRGALKAYRKHCFIQIGELKPAMGWDTADELLARFHGWKVVTDESLLVKHLRPTGMNYFEHSGRKQGEAFYRLRYGIFLSLIASAKLAAMKMNPFAFLHYVSGYFQAQNKKRPFLVSEEEGRFIRKLRWANIRKKIA
ncbi:glycosyltransferase family 2 protein [Christiangramia sp. SM2212]|uniref:Glycosyltransferase family 2 protein n=1 Tax=Christiangramia sediminicola TaxID=3073267 RepID=A0ABU1EU68_9FLAO|nr:glycosyltransferase family 2 protein [Christiangramia sp. SM2212]MDR5591718.1 glycosyltransferase family 2 protein [Christiangramia sp. SM2212]